MGIAYNPKMVTNGLVMCLDAGNETKSCADTYGVSFDGSGDFLSMPANAAFDFGAGDFTIEAWVYISDDSSPDPSNLRRAQIFDVSATNTDGIIFWINGSATTTGTGLTIYNGSLTVSVTATIPQKQLNHIAVSKSGTSVYFFLNGTQVGTTQTTSGNWGSATLIPKIAGRSTSTYNFYLNGYISNLRVLKGTALYTANFSPPRGQLTAIANTSLLTCQSQTFVDNSTNNFTVTGNGNSSIRPFKSLAIVTTINDLSGSGSNGTLTNGPTYSNANGGSLVFDGANDYIQCSGTAIKWTQNGSVGFTNITVEFWIKVNADQGRFFSKPWNGGGQYNIDINESTFGLWSGASSAYLAHPVSISDNTWRHVTCWANSTNMGTYVNGTQYSSTQAHGLTGGIGSSGDASVPLALMTLYPYGEGWAGNAIFSTLGQMSICKVYNRVLTPAEIQQNFNATRGRFGI